MKKKDSTGYSGALNKHILLDDPFQEQRKEYPGPFLMTHDIIQREEKAILSARVEKIADLFAYFEIPSDHPDKWKWLALMLAFKHVPGFQYRRKEGAPVKITDTLLSEFYNYFVETKKNMHKSAKGKRTTDKMVCKKLTKDTTFKKQFPKLSGTAEGQLQNLYKTAKDQRETMEKWEDDLAGYLHRTKDMPTEEMLYAFPSPPYPAHGKPNGLHEKYAPKKKSGKVAR